MDSIFTKIVKGEIAAHKIAEDDRFLAFLDVFPLQKGHTLVIPKQQIDYIFDLDDTLLADLMVFAKKVAGGVKKATRAPRIGVTVIGLEVPQTHVHLIPISKMDDMKFSHPKKKFPEAEMAEIARQIRESL